MKWDEVLNELFDRAQDLQIEWTENNYEREATITELKLIVDFARSINWNYVEIAFSVGHEYEITGAGNAINIFNAVLKSVDQYMQKFRHPHQITFGADNSEPSRIKLYKRLAQRLSNSYGYELNDIIDKYGEHKFKLNKIGAFADEPLAEMATAYHGSPHVGIAKFCTSKIGTGEGAQAYGWGLYFTDSPKIAEWYRENLTTEQEYVNGVPMDLGNPEHYLAWVLGQESGNAEEAKEYLNFMITRGGSQSIRQTASKALEMLEQGHAPQVEYRKPKGKVYQVEIPEDDTMLWWELPLSEQPKNVKGVLKKVPPNVIKSAKMQTSYGIVNGNTLYYELVNMGVAKNERGASEYLASLGIKGIKYLAGDSRHGTNEKKEYNYVIFNGDDIKILKELK